MEIKAWSNLFKESLKDYNSSRENDLLLQRIFEKTLGFNRADLVLNSSLILKQDELDLLNEILEELKKNKPLEYIFEEAYFMGFAFYVNSNVLIPRPETEELVMLVLEEEKENDFSVFDIGTGCGCIPIGLKKERESLQIDACEVSVKALEIAKKNGKELRADVNWFLMDILKDKPDKCYDVVVSNPPYVKPEELKILDKKVMEWEPEIALAPKKDPLEFYKRMIQIVDQLLVPGGRFYWEIHEDLGPEVISLFPESDFQNIQLLEDMYGRNRFVISHYTP